MKKRKGLSMRYQITSDSTCDLSPEQLEQYNIRLLPLYVSMAGKTLRDGVDVKPDDIYAHVSAGGSLPQTAAVNLADYVRAFTELSKKNDFVIHVCISLDFSCCYQNAKLAAADFDNVYVVDSRNLSTGHGLVVLEAERMAREGMAPDDIVAALHDLTGRVEASFILDRLDYMKKGGRCSAVTLLGANLLRLRPCIEVRDGKMGVGKKYRGSFDKCVCEYITDKIGTAAIWNCAACSSRTPACRRNRCKRLWKLCKSYSRLRRSASRGPAAPSAATAGRERSACCISERQINEGSTGSALRLIAGADRHALRVRAGADRKKQGHESHGHHRAAGRGRAAFSRLHRAFAGGGLFRKARDRYRLRCGFPGVPLKIAEPSIELTLLDSLAKRMTWLREILPQLGVEAEVVTARAEEFVQTRREQYDIATSRAVARLNILAELCCRM